MPAHVTLPKKEACGDLTWIDGHSHGRAVPDIKSRLKGAGSDRQAGGISSETAAIGLS